MAFVFLNKSKAGVGQSIYTGSYFDSPTSLVYDNARYYNPSQGQFLTQDPVFLGQPNQQTLQDPQSLNPYSYSEDNPITKSDATGRATYVWANGAGMNAIDTWNTGTYYQTADNEQLQANAALMQTEQAASSISGLNDWINLVQTGGDWDFKSVANAQAGGRGFYFFGNQFVSADTYGNLNYGYAGTAGGFSPSELQIGGGVAQILAHRSINLAWYNSYFNNSINIGKIQEGINSYNQANNACYATAQQMQYLGSSGSSFSGSQIGALEQVGSAFGYSTLTNGQVQAAAAVKAAFSK